MKGREAGGVRSDYDYLRFGHSGTTGPTRPCSGPKSDGRAAVRRRLGAHLQLARAGTRSGPGDFAGGGISCCLGRCTGLLGHGLSNHPPARARADIGEARLDKQVRCRDVLHAGEALAGACDELAGPALQSACQTPHANAN